MKTNVFKFVLPAFAMLLAIGLTFATEANRTAPIGYYDDPFVPGIQQVPTDCETQANGNLCTHNGYQLYDEPALVTPLKERVNP